ncbi:MAG: hypothetical protein LGB73_05000 [Sulfurovum sp.]|nr:hypothetical protein [Sulfurovum sp.]MCB4779030.1 hypothetical protein [Sulfurovum sp.]
MIQQMIPIVLLLFFMTSTLISKPFKVANYNVENLFDTIYNGTEYEEFVPGKHGWSSRMVEKKLNHTAEVLCDLNADIVGLEEIENEQIFRQLQKRLKRVGCNYEYGAITHKKDAAIQVALLSRFPILSKQELQVSHVPHVRNILEVTVDVEGLPFTLFVNHWKSKGHKGYESKRLSYAKVLASYIEKMPKERAYMILGDLNSNYDAHLTLPQRLDDTNGKRALQHLLHTVQGRKLFTEDDVRLGKRGRHYDLWLELSPQERWNHKFYGKKSTLGHMLLPQSMLDGKGIDYVNDSFRVFKPRYLFTPKGYINRWQMREGKHTGEGYSDHLPIFALFDTKPYLPLVTKNQKALKSSTIEMLYATDKLDAPVVLKDVVVVLERGRSVVIKQYPKGRGVFVFGLVGLREGHRYDLTIQTIHTYKGLKEITAISHITEKGRVALSAYYGSFDKMRQNEVVRNLVGVYQKGYFCTDGKKIPIYFKSRKLIPRNGTKIKIAIAHIGYYRRLQLVIYSKKDFTILEK